MCRYPEVQYFVWKSPFSLAIQARLVSSSNPTVDAKINDLEIGVICMQLLIFSPRMAPLAHTHTYFDNMAVYGWANRGSVSTALSIRPILWELSFLARQKHSHASICRTPGEDNNMTDAALRLTHLPDLKFIFHLRTHFSQSKSWRLPPLSSMCRWQLTNMLH